MGREVKRVALDFNWPMDKTWGGFLNPFYSQCIKCPDCEGSGSSPEVKLLTDQWYGNAPFRPEDRGSKPFLPTDEAVQRFAKRQTERTPEYYGSGDQAVMREARRLCELFNSHWCHHLNADDVAALIESDRLYDFTHHFIPGEGWKPNDPIVVPTPEQVNIWSLTGFGHDSCNQWAVISAEAKRMGYEEDCKRCAGSGELWPSPGIKAAYENWTKTEPPTGEGWQVWETVSEGSPITPVFATAEALVDYLVEGGDGWDRKRRSGGWSRKNAESFVGLGFAPSMITQGDKVFMPRDGIPA